MPSLSPLSVAVLLLLVMTCGCSQTATITLTPDALPPEGATAEKDDDSWEVEAEIVRSDINVVHVEQNGTQYTVAHESIEEIDHPGDGLIHGGFGLMLVSLPVSIGFFAWWASLPSGYDVDEGFDDGITVGDKRLKSTALALTWIAPVSMILGGASMVILGFRWKGDSETHAQSPGLAKELSLQPFLVPSGQGMTGGLQLHWRY